jgi:eukaryotic-like serine/threonine-protein kinase
VQIPGYEAVELLDSGGVGDVYRARRNATGGFVAIKVVRGAGDVATVERRVRREVELLVALKGHAHVVQIEDVLSTDQGPAIVMEYMSGGSVHAELGRRGPFGVAETIFVGMALTTALRDAHKRGIVHRDIKPHNLLIGSFGHVKVCDFGIAAVVRAGDASDRTEAYTRRYASPEEVNDEPVGPPADIYSAGITLRQLATGETSEQRANLVLAGSAALGRMEALVSRMTERIPRDRPTADDVRVELEAMPQLIGIARIDSLEPSDEVDATVLRGSVAAPGQLRQPAPGIGFVPTRPVPTVTSVRAEWWQ